MGVVDDVGRCDILGVLAVVVILLLDVVIVVMFIPTVSLTGLELVGKVLNGK